MTERTKVIEDFSGIAERLKEIRRERGEVVTGEIGIAGPAGNPTAPQPPLTETSYDDYGCSPPSWAELSDFEADSIGYGVCSENREAAMRAAVMRKRARA